MKSRNPSNLAGTLKEQPRGQAQDQSIAERSTRGARRDALIYLPASLVPSIVSMLTSVVFTRLFLPEAWGYYTLAMSVAQVAIAAQSSWLERSTVRLLPLHDPNIQLPTRGNPIWLPVRLTGWNTLIYSIGALIGAVVISWLYPDTTGIVLATALFGGASIACSGLGSIHRALLNAWEVTTATMVASTMGFVISLLAIILLGVGPAWLIFGPAIGQIAGLILLGRSLSKKVLKTTRPNWRTNFHLIRSSISSEGATARTYVAYGLPLTGFSIAGWLLNLSDRFFIFGFRGPIEAGIYSPNYSLGSLVISLVAVPLSSAATARLLRLSDSTDTVTIQSAVKGASRDFLLVTTPLVVWLITSAHDVAAVLLGAEFRSGSTVIPLVGAATYFWALGMYVHKGLEVKRRTLTMLGLAVACSLANVLLNILLVPHFGYIAAGWSTLASFIFYPILAYIFTFRVMRWIVPWRTMLWLAVGSTISMLIAHYGVNRIEMLGSLGRAAANGVLVVSVMAIVLLAVREISIDTLRSLRSDIQSRLEKRETDA
jgi:O-antigen/teichoic acid export membrane protein